MNKIIGLLRSKIGVALLGAVIFLATMAFLMSRGLTQAQAEAKLEAEKTYKPSSMGGSWEMPNPEVEQMIEQLRVEREAVRERAQQLNDLEIRLKTDRIEMDNLMVTVRQLQEDFDRSILRVQEEETANLKRLAKVYSSMEPASAVTILKELDDYSLVKILLYVKDAEVAPILEALSKLGPSEAKRAAGVSESLRTAVAAKLGATQPGPTTLAKGPAANPTRSPATNSPAATPTPPPASSAPPTSK
jgi:flagellar motility protein MotE (MotC chaperone)